MCGTSTFGYLVVRYLCKSEKSWSLLCTSEVTSPWICTSNCRNYDADRKPFSSSCYGLATVPEHFLLENMPAAAGACILIILPFLLEAFWMNLSLNAEASSFWWSTYGDLNIIVGDSDWDLCASFPISSGLSAWGSAWFTCCWSCSYCNYCYWSYCPAPPIWSAPVLGTPIWLSYTAACSFLNSST